MMRILMAIAALACAVQTWGEMVSYVDEHGVTQQVDATVVISSGSRVTWSAGWYAVTNDVTITGGADCSGAVKLILMDGAKLTINDVAEDNAGIGVSGDGNSFAVYAQADGTGALDVAGGAYGAGIGGGAGGAGSNITIAGGMVTATGGFNGAGIGGGYDGSASNVKVDPLALIVKANGTVVANDGGDLAAALRGKSFVVIMPSTVPVGEGLAATFAAGVCTISGEGAMSEHVPLMGDDSADGMLELCRNDIRSLVIGNGVTSVAPERFNAFPALTNVTIAASVARIGAGAFANCSALESITFLGDTLPTIEEGALDVRVSIELVDGIPVVSSTPYVMVGERAPRLMGAKSLANPIYWEQVEAGKGSEYKFFKVEIK